MEYEISQVVEFDDRKFEVIDDIGKKQSEKKKASLWSAVLAIALFIATVVLGFFGIRWVHPPMCFAITIWSFVILIAGYAVYIFVHELLRGLIFLAFGGVGKRNISFGVILKQGTVYCLSKVPVRLRRVRVSLLVPFFITFVPLFVIGILLGDIVYIMGSALALAVSAADFYYLWILRKQKGSSFLLEDKPDKIREEFAGYILKEEISIESIGKEQ